MESLWETRGQNPWGQGLLGFWPWDFSRDSIHQIVMKYIKHTLLLYIMQYLSEVHYSKLHCIMCFQKSCTREHHCFGTNLGQYQEILRVFGNLTTMVGNPSTLVENPSTLVENSTTTMVGNPSNLMENPSTLVENSTTIVV